MATPGEPPVETKRITTLQMPKGQEHLGKPLRVVILPVQAGETIKLACYSSWRFTWLERLRILFTGRAWVSTWGVPPPMSLGAGKDYAPQTMEFDYGSQAS